MADRCHRCYLTAIDKPFLFVGFKHQDQTLNLKNDEAICTF